MSSACLSNRRRTASFSSSRIVTMPKSICPWDRLRPTGDGWAATCSATNIVDGGGGGRPGSATSTVFRVVAHALEQLPDRALAIGTFGAPRVIGAFLAFQLDQVIVTDVDLRLLGEWDSCVDLEPGVVAMDSIEVATHDAERSAAV